MKTPQQQLRKKGIIRDEECLRKALECVPEELKEGSEIYVDSENKNMPVAERIGYNTMREQTIRNLKEAFNK